MKPKIDKLFEASAPIISRYRVHVCRIAYSHLDIEVEARSQAEAEVAAEQEAGNHVFPTENSSEYQAQGCVKL